MKTEHVLSHLTNAYSYIQQPNLYYANLALSLVATGRRSA